MEKTNTRTIVQENPGYQQLQKLEQGWMKIFPCQELPLSLNMVLREHRELLTSKKRFFGQSKQHDSFSAKNSLTLLILDLFFYK